jgi:MoaA/NifB/PqqE/SkfB family radical SAM enzyme
MKVELTEGCNLRCGFCGLQGIREKGDKTYKFLTVEHARFIAEQVRDLGWNSRFEFAMRGEPTINPDFIDIVRAFRTILPQASLMMTSNGAGFLRRIRGYDETHSIIDNLHELFAAGLNVLCLDDYQGVNLVPRIRAAIEHPPLNTLPPMFEYPDQKAGNPYGRHKPSTKMIVFFKDISIPQDGVHNYLSNHCGGAAPLNDKKKGKRCARPFREFAIHYNGNVPICCNDWRGVFKAGNVFVQGLGAVWQSAYLDAARRKLYRGERDFGPCLGCDSHSHRTGILPDPAGRDTMPAMDPEAEAALKAAVEGSSYTVPVLRAWEVK